MDRADSDTQYIRQMMGTLERKLEEEQQFRLRNEEDLKRYFENKWVGL